MHGARQAPSAQTFPLSHSLEYLQAFWGAVQVPLTQTFGAVQAGPVPQAVPGAGPPSELVVGIPASTTVPGVLPGS